MEHELKMATDEEYKQVMDLASEIGVKLWDIMIEKEENQHLFFSALARATSLMFTPTIVDTGITREELLAVFLLTLNSALDYDIGRYEKGSLIKRKS